MRSYYSWLSWGTCTYQNLNHCTDELYYVRLSRNQENEDEWITYYYGLFSSGVNGHLSRGTNTHNLLLTEREIPRSSMRANSHQRHVTRKANIGDGGRGRPTTRYLSSNNRSVISVGQWVLNVAHLSAERRFNCHEECLVCFSTCLITEARYMQYIVI